MIKLKDFLLNSYLLAGIVGIIFCVIATLILFKIPISIAILILALELLMVELSFVFEERRRR